MSVASALRNRIASWIAPERDTETREHPSWAAMTAFGGPAGGAVPPHMAENLSAVMASVNAISTAIASLPAFVQRRSGGKLNRADEHPIARLIDLGPNAWQAWPDFMDWLVAQTLLQGNGLAEIVTDSRGAPAELRPIPWQWVSVQMLPSGRLAYDIQDVQGRQRRLLQDEVLHLRDRTDDGLVGRSRLSRARSVLETGMQVQTFTERFYQHGMSPSGVIELEGNGRRSEPKVLTEPQQRMLREQIREEFQGAKNTAKVLVMPDENLKWRQLGVSAEDADLLNARRYSGEEIARIFQVPPPIIGDLSKGTFTNTETVGRWFAQNTLTPWIRKIEAEFSRSVFPESSRSTHRLTFDLSGFLRGDPEQRWQAHKIAVDSGILDPDEVRQIEGYEPRGDGAGQGRAGGGGRGTEARSLDELTPAQREALQRRLEIRERHRPELVEAMQPLVERDAAAVLEALENGTVDELLERHGREFGGDEGAVATALAPAAMRMLGEVHTAVERETGQTLDNAEPFTRAMLGSEGTAYSQSTRAQIHALRDNPEALRERVRDWRENRAREIGTKVSVRIETGATHRLYRKAGRRRVKVVDQKGRNIDGPIDRPFVEQGDSIGDDLEASAPLHHPPLAPGDERSIVAADEG